MNSKKGLALYELISANKPAGKALRSECSNPEQEQDEHLERNVLTPGRSVRMSIGTIGVILAVSVALIVISYTMGFRRGSAIAREDYGNRLFDIFLKNFFLLYCESPRLNHFLFLYQLYLKKFL